MSSKISIPKIEFYITNVCNLTCDHCNRFNNLNFKGWQDWNDYKDLYQRWGRLIDIDHVVFLGGEPLLNPSIIDWVEGIDKIWRGHHQILTNGTRLNKVRGLYDILQRGLAWVGISAHNLDELDLIFGEVSKFLKAPIEKRVGKHLNKHGADFVFQDANNIEIMIWIQDQFTKSALIHQDNGTFTLHQSNPVQAHAHCAIAQMKSYHFIKGKLYKCGPVALFPELDQQFGLELSDQDRSLINEYQPLTLDNFNFYSAEFFKNLDNPILQCKFCPEKNNFFKIFPSVKKHRVAL